MPNVPGGLWQNLIAIQVYGANTGVGKTVASTLLGAHFVGRSTKQKIWKVRYFKPVSTGPQEDRDDKYVTRYGGSLNATTLFQFDDPVSPHVAARGFNNAPSDESIVQILYDRLQSDALSLSECPSDAGISIIETAGGVLSPGPSGTPQADIYRPMRLPVVLVGDHRLGGIASTISSAESLLIRGYDIDAVVCFNDHSKFENANYLKKHFRKLGISTIELPWIPDLSGSTKEHEAEQMRNYYEAAARTEGAHKLADKIEDRHSERLTNMGNMASRTQDVIWHPFTQHKHIEKADDILVFDSAYGDYFQAKHTAKSLDSKQQHETSHLYPAFDGSASWWTQGLGHGNPKLSLAAAYAAGRYGHIMFAGATHEPALTLAELLLRNLQNPRLTKVFYTDDGSTALEVGIKMGLRAACKRYDWDGSTEPVGVLGLKGSYHGDTIGAMDASEPCVYNKKADWYRGRGYWFDFPTVKMQKGRWIVEPPAGMEDDFGPTQDFENLDHIFDNETRGHSARYEAYITRTLDELIRNQGLKFGALVMEPIILGAGGMLFVDPLFQRTLINVVRSYNFASSTQIPPPNDPKSWTGLPVVFDEVFTGLYRLGRFSASSFLQLHPDISCHAKLLTGGLLPLSVTIASDSIFQAFWGDEKSDALLHGHSYTAHPIGCHVANKSLVAMKRLNSGRDWATYRGSWFEETETSKSAATSPASKKKTWSMWTKSTVVELSNHARVDSVIALGSVLAVTLKDLSGSGYTSTAALSLRDALLNDSTGEVRVHSRVLGNVIYFMASMTSKPEHLAAVERELLAKLDKADV